MTTTMKTIAATLAIYTAGALAPAPAAQASVPLFTKHQARTVSAAFVRHVTGRPAAGAVGHCARRSRSTIRCDVTYRNVEAVVDGWFGTIRDTLTITRRGCRAIVRSELVVSATYWIGGAR